MRRQPLSRFALTARLPHESGLNCPLYNAPIILQYSPIPGPSSL